MLLSCIEFYNPLSLAVTQRTLPEHLGEAHCAGPAIATKAKAGKGTVIFISGTLTQWKYNDDANADHTKMQKMLKRAP